MRYQLLLKLEFLPNETCKTLRLGIAANFRLHLKGTLIKLNRISEDLMHRSFVELFLNHEKFVW